MTPSITETVTVYYTILTGVSDMLIYDITSGSHGDTFINILLEYPDATNDQTTLHFWQPIREA
jgi:hypothetical protein